MKAMDWLLLYACVASTISLLLNLRSTPERDK